MFFFFFSSRRRHTRYWRDWSSDVCSSDLAMDQELVSDSLVYRYDPSASPDGLRGTEGTFSICTFWYVDALARSGRLEEARLTFEKIDRKSTRLNSSHANISYAVFCLKKKNKPSQCTRHPTSH